MKSLIKQYYSLFSTTSLQWLFWIYIFYPLAAILCTPIIKLEEVIHLATSLVIIFVEVFGSHLLFTIMEQKASEIPNHLSVSFKWCLVLDTIRRFISYAIIYAGISFKEGVYYATNFMCVYDYDSPFYYAKGVILPLMLTALIVFAISTIAVFLCKISKKSYVHYIVLLIALLLYAFLIPVLK